MPDQPNRLFLEFQAVLAGRYSLERELGRGGMGVVYLAREVRLDRLVAIKLLPPHHADDSHLRDRFLREARTAAKLSHPHIIPIFAVDEVGAFVFFAMAYVAGETLTERVRRRGPLPPSEAGRLLREVAWALAYAHSQGLVHRDVKPDNIMLEEATGRALVADFGIAGQVRGAAGLDGGEVIGTPEFMSPEQALGEHVDGRSDMYALGIVGYFALSGKLPFEAGKATEVLAKQITEPAPPLASVAAAVPRRLAHAIDRCLEKDPGDRPETAEQLATQLGLALEQRKGLPVALRVFVANQTQVSEGPVVAAGFLLLIISGLVVAVVDAAGLQANPSIWLFVATLVAGAVVAPAALIARQVRRLAAAGYRPQDLAHAFRVHLEEGRDARAFEHGRDPTVFERLMRILGLSGLVVAFGTGVALWLGVQWPYTAGLWGWFWPSVTIGLGSGLISVMRLQRRRDVASGFWSRLWGSRVGRWLFELSSVALKRDALQSSSTHRPTELALGLAAEQLFEQLPRETRHQFHELPAIVRRLQGDAQRMRQRLEELNDALGGKGDVASGKGGDAALGTRHDRIVADLETERRLVHTRLADAVKALETIRLNLLRLHAGSGSVQSLTTDLGLAREVAAEINLLLEGRREIERELG